MFPAHLFSAATLPREIVKTYISAKLNKIMKISQWDVILIKISICQSSMVHGEHSVTRVGNREASTVFWKESASWIPLSGYQAAADGAQRVAVDELVLSQEDKPKRHRSAREISHETAILSSVRWIIHRDLQLKCFKWCRAQLLSEANRISRLTHWWTTLSSAINLVIVLL